VSSRSFGIEASRLPRRHSRPAVNDLEASLDYYIRVLGFKQDWRDDDGNSFAPFLAVAVICSV
jgi:catechol 2,3-dioxygenase-like lactoylglutathione lyase family enzyme